MGLLLTTLQHWCSGCSRTTSFSVALTAQSMRVCRLQLCCFDALPGRMWAGHSLPSQSELEGQ
jgi:hypothetical protein